MRYSDVAEWARDHRFAVDCVLAFAMALPVIVLSGQLSTLTFTLCLVQLVPLAFRRVAPLAAAFAVAVLCLVQVVVTDTMLYSNVGVLMVMYAVVVYSNSAWGRRLVLAAGAIGTAVAGARWSAGTQPDGFTWAAFLFTTGLLGMLLAVTWVLGESVRHRHKLFSRLEEQNAALARDRDQRAALAAQQERAMIAREMHDIVAHSLAVVVVQADGAVYATRTALERDGESPPLRQALTTLETVANTAREALGETRRLVGVLRDDDADAEYVPLERLASVHALAQRVRDAGVQVHVHTEGDLEGLDTGVDLTAFRVVQEGLTNVLKHAGPGTTAHVSVTVRDDEVRVRVDDDGTGGATPSDGAGHGIIGMRERVTAYGGTVEAGPRATGGFRVEAVVPRQKESA